MPYVSGYKPMFVVEGKKEGPPPATTSGGESGRGLAVSPLIRVEV